MSDFLHEQYRQTETQPAPQVAWQLSPGEYQQFNNTSQIRLNRDNQQLINAGVFGTLDIDFGNTPLIAQAAGADRQSGRQVPSQTDNIGRAPKAPLPRIEIREDIKPGVSKGFKDETENWIHNRVPRHIQQLMHDNGIVVTVYASSSQVPANIREQHARRHNDENEKVGNLDMFYDPNSHSMVFIEHPDKTAKQQNSQDILTRGHVQNFAYGPDEENAWHELGHALDNRALKDFSHSKEFDDAFRKDLDRMDPKQREAEHP